MQGAGAGTHEPGGKEGGAMRTVAERRRRLDVQVQQAMALEEACRFDQAMDLREDIRRCALTLPRSRYTAADDDLGAAQGLAGDGDVSEKPASEGSQCGVHAEEDAAVTDLLRGCDAAVERCSAMLVEQALSGMAPLEWARAQEVKEAKRKQAALQVQALDCRVLS